MLEFIVFVWGLIKTTKQDTFETQLRCVNSRLASAYAQNANRPITGGYKFSDLFYSTGDRWVIEYKIFCRFIMFIIGSGSHNRALFDLFQQIVETDLDLNSYDKPFRDLQNVQAASEYFNVLCGQTIERLTGENVQQTRAYGPGVEQMKFLKRVYDFVYQYHCAFSTDVRVGEKLLLSQEPVCIEIFNTTGIFSFRTIIQSRINIIYFLQQFMTLFETEEFSRQIVHDNDVELHKSIKTNGKNIMRMCKTEMLRNHVSDNPTQ